MLLRSAFLILLFFLTGTSFAQDSLKSKSYADYSYKILYTEPFYPSLSSPICMLPPTCYQPPCINKAKTDSLQKVLNLANAASNEREFYYYMWVNECNCETKLIKAWKWPKNHISDESKNTISGEEFRRSPNRSSNPAAYVKTLFSEIQ
jgi:hypothetical protein